MRPYLVALALFVIGLVNVARGLEFAGAEYRPWALHHASYSDVIALGGDRYLDGDHPVPYIDDRIEYPVVIGFLLWAPSFVPGGATGHLLATALLLGACLIAIVWLLGRVPGANPWLFAASPALVLFGVLNWDLAGIALLLAGLTSPALLGLGIATKLFPAAAIPALRPRSVVVAIAVNVPLALLAFDNWAHFFRFSSKRPPDFSIWNALSITAVPVVNALTLAALVAAMAVAYRYRTNVRVATAFVMAVWLATNKVSSPQYALWLFAVAALVNVPWRLWGAMVVVTTADFLCELWLFPRHALALRPAVAAMVLARTAVELWFAWWCLHRLRVEVAPDEGAEVGGDARRDRPRLTDRLNLTG